MNALKDFHGNTWSVPQQREEQCGLGTFPLVPRRGAAKEGTASSQQTWAPPLHRFQALRLGGGA